MPVTKSAEKRVNTSEKARIRNASIKTRISSVRRKTLEAFAAGDPEASDKRFREYCSVLDKAAKKGVIKKNTSVRRKKRAAESLAALSKETRKPETGRT